MKDDSLKAFRQILNGKIPRMEEETVLLPEGSDIPLFEEEDIEILLHKEAHFCGKYEPMIAYYQTGDNKGVCEQIHPRRIQQIQRIEETLKVSLYTILVSSFDKARVSFFVKMKKDFLNLAEKFPNSFEAKCICAILSEEEVEDVVEKDEELFFQNPKLLLDIATSSVLSDVLSPGYGQAPTVAILLLGKAKYTEGIRDLFSLLGSGDFCRENAILWALSQMGEAAYLFALDVYTKEPKTKETENAALVLQEFSLLNF